MSFLKGWIGEKMAAFSMWFWLNAKIYHRFHNVILASSNGTAQLDHIIVSAYGVFIVETKNKTGWIFGSEKQARWTQVIYGHKYSFQNPLRQTYRQKKVLAACLKIREEVIRPVVFFIGDSHFKTPMPANVIGGGLSIYIQSFKAPVLSPSEVDRIIRELSTYVSESKLKARDHLRSLRERHASTQLCPSCGAQLVQRTAKKGPHAGSQFWGCKRYPQCKFSKDV